MDTVRAMVLQLHEQVARFAVVQHSVLIARLAIINQYGAHVFNLRKLPDTAAVGGDTDEASIRRHVDIVYAHVGQVTAVGRPVGSAVGSAVDADVRGRVNSVL